jgi:hypothetical protein
VGGVGVENHVGCFVGRTLRSTELRKGMHSLCRCLCMQRPITLPSRTLRVPNKVVVQLRL